MTSEQDSPVSEDVEQQTEVAEQEVEKVEQEQVQEQNEEERKIPLSALEAERRKRQDAEAQNRLYQEYLSQAQQSKQPEEDDSEDLLSKGEFKKNLSKEISSVRREILEEAFVSANPDAAKQIEEQLPNLIQQKPWIKEVIENAPNRWQRSWELVRDLGITQKQEAPSKKKQQEAKRVIENAQKPGSPTTVGKSVVQSKVEYMRSIRNTPEWDEYRQKVMRGEV